MSGCCASLDKIEKLCGGGNTPGLKSSVQVVCIDELFCIPEKDAGTHNVTSNIPVSNFYTWAFSKNGNSYVAEPSGSDDNQSWITKIEFYIPKISPLTTHILNATSNSNFLLIACDKCGNKRIIGDVDDGASLSIKEQTNDQNGYIVTANYTGNLACFFTGDLQIVPTPVLTFTP